MIMYLFVSASEVLRIVKNDFPYYLESDIQHYVLWANDCFPMSRCRSFVDQHFPSNHYDVIMFENLSINKSVKTVHHLQLLVREKANTQPSDEMALRPKMWSFVCLFVVFLCIIMLRDFTLYVHAAPKVQWMCLCFLMQFRNQNKRTAYDMNSKI